ncbi:hypothetical protein NQ317_015479 [Molorchus minor]|uniref:Sperm-tail PG-rich repeat-containing protein 2 n=1 Tax=Molorchus minor TaxID=1323400 RepID=A0ABQ9JGW6_9CUCU|nr:hypothetical protein NQ317_015479 [Molorchus minor]
MYSLSARDFNPGRSQTSPCVGPNTYVICTDRDPRVNRVPFLSSKKKEPTFLNKIFTEALYALPEFGIKGGSTPRNKAERFIYDDSCTPGPANYNAKLPKCNRIDPTPIPGKGRLYACRVPYTIQASAPSVPTKIDANGYEIDEDDNIVKIPPDEHDRTMGPAYYHVNTSTFCTHYRGCKWAQRTSQRDPPPPDVTPGPGAYDVQLPSCQKREEEDEVREMARRFSFVPRFIEAQQLRFQREGMPGPADYDVRKNKICEVCPGIHPRPFITTSKRFTQIGIDTPSPGEYDLLTVKYSTSKKAVPFSVQSSRFVQKKLLAIPGPGDYEIKSPINEKLRSKKNEFALFEPPFNVTSRRDTSSIKKDAPFTPSPADYTLNGEGNCKIPLTSVFKSKVDRIKKMCKTTPTSFNCWAYRRTTIICNYNTQNFIGKYFM